MTERRARVHVDIDGAPVLAGELFLRVLRGREGASFRYHPGWLEHPRRFALDPVALPLRQGTFATAAGASLFAGLSDSAPDRWGRALMQRANRRRGETRTLFELDYVLGVHDVSRQGALRFEVDGELVSTGPPVPPLVRLAELVHAAGRVEDDDEDAATLQLLLAPGSSLGGARPKASVRDGDVLHIAKFPSRGDTWPVIAWEEVTCRLARLAGIPVAPTRLVGVEGRRVLLAARFDRQEGARIPYLSGLALIGAADGEDHSYLELADGVRVHGADAAADLRALWRRMVFNVLVSNTDDHLRNHGFLRAATGWRLAPAFDLNPTPTDIRPRVHALALDESDHDASLATVLSAAPYFDLADAEARSIAREVASATSGWRRVAGGVGLGKREIERMASAFEHADLASALGA